MNRNFSRREIFRGLAKQRHLTLQDKRHDAIPKLFSFKVSFAQLLMWSQADTHLTTVRTTNVKNICFRRMHSRKIKAMMWVNTLENLSRMSVFRVFRTPSAPDRN
jgi:hypothetical protein